MLVKTSPESEIVVNKEVDLKFNIVVIPVSNLCIESHLLCYNLELREISPVNSFAISFTGKRMSKQSGHA